MRPAHNAIVHTVNNGTHLLHNLLTLSSSRIRQAPDDTLVGDGKCGLIDTLRVEQVALIASDIGLLVPVPAFLASASCRLLALGPYVLPLVLRWSTTALFAEVFRDLRWNLLALTTTRVMDTAMERLALLVFTNISTIIVIWSPAPLALLGTRGFAVSATSAVVLVW